MRLIGITGRIGSGKTTVGNILRDLGFVVFDMDVWCRKMYYEKAFLEIIKKNFPYSFINKQFDKSVLRKRVFSDSQELKKLENLTHPYLKQKLLKLIHQYRFNQNLFFIENALLYKIGLDKYCSNIIITKAPYDVMKERVIKRDLIKEEDFENIFFNQDDDDIFQMSDIIIKTDIPIQRLKADIIKKIKGLELC